MTDELYTSSRILVSYRRLEDIILSQMVASIAPWNIVALRTHLVDTEKSYDSTSSVPPNTRRGANEESVLVF